MIQSSKETSFSIHSSCQLISCSTIQESYKHTYLFASSQVIIMTSMTMVHTNLNTHLQFTQNYDSQLTDHNNHSHVLENTVSLLSCHQSVLQCHLPFEVTCGHWALGRLWHLQPPHHLTVNIQKHQRQIRSCN